MAAKTTGSGRIDKREAILRAAFTVFAREGYAQACVRDIAAEAGVAKPTVYSHLSDKATLFRHATAAEAERELASSLAAVEQLTGQLDGHGGDVAAMLENVGLELLRCHCADRSWALRRLLYAEVARFPELLETVRGRGANRVHEALADRLARLALAGHLGRVCVDEAAEQFLALLTGPMEQRSLLGTRAVPDAELRAVAQAAVRTFLLAFGAETERPASSHRVN